MVSLSDNCLGGERDRVYNSARVSACECGRSVCCTGYFGVAYTLMLICLPGTCWAHCSWDFIKKNVIFAWVLQSDGGGQRGRERDSSGVSE